MKVTKRVRGHLLKSACVEIPTSLDLAAYGSPEIMVKLTKI